MNAERSPSRTTTLFAAFAAAAILVPAGTASADKVKLRSAASAPLVKDTSDWYKNAECQLVFFTVMEGLYRDGISKEIVDLVIGRVESNDLEKAFIFRCKLCHACYEAFAAYQRRPAFHGTEGVDVIGRREIAPAIVESLRNGGRIEFDNAFAAIVQPWIKAKLIERLEAGEDGLEMLQRYVKLAAEGNDLIAGYARCQACDAINDVAQNLRKE